MIENAGFVVDCPDYLGYFPVRVENDVNLDLATVTMWFNMPKSNVCVHVWSCLVMDLGIRTKCRHFSKLYANNCVWKNVKKQNKIKYRTSSTSRSYIADKVCRQELSVIKI